MRNSTSNSEVWLSSGLTVDDKYINILTTRYLLLLLLHFLFCNAIIGQMSVTVTIASLLLLQVFSREVLVQWVVYHLHREDNQWWCKTGHRFSNSYLSKSKLLVCTRVAVHQRPNHHLHTLSSPRVLPTLRHLLLPIPLPSKTATVPPKTSERVLHLVFIQVLHQPVHLVPFPYQPPRPPPWPDPLLS